MLLQNHAAARSLQLASIGCRCVSSSAVLARERAGRHKRTPHRTKPLTYDQANLPHHIGLRKSWLTWHTSALEGFKNELGRRVAEDEIIRRFVRGIWIDTKQIFATDIVIKRRANLIVIAGIIERMVPPKKVYWLIGFTEELLSLILKCPVKMEIQTVESRDECVYLYV